MDTLNADRRLAWLMLFCCVGSTAFFIGSALATSLVHTARENGPIENYELATLGPATLIFLAFGFMSRDVPRVVGFGMAIFCSYCFIREADFYEFGPDFWAAFIDNRVFKIWWHGLTALAFAAYVFIRRDLLPDLLRYSFSSRAWPLHVSGITLVIAVIVERIYVRIWHIPILEFTEECFECMAFTMMLLSAIWFFRNAWMQNRA